MQKEQYPCIWQGQHTFDEGKYSDVLQTIWTFDIKVQQFLITCNFINQIAHLRWIKYWQAIAVVFTCCELFYRFYSITCFKIKNAGNVSPQIITGLVPQPTDAFYDLSNCALPTVVITSAEVAEKFHFIVLTLRKSIIKMQIYAWHGHAMQLSRQALQKPCLCNARQVPELFTGRHQAQTALLFWCHMLVIHRDGNI